MTEYKNITLVSYNPSNSTNRQLYQEIARALGTELREIVPPILSRESVEQICEGKPPRLFIHDGSTYKNDPLIKNLRAIGREELLDYIVKYRFPAMPPVAIYNGRELEVSDALRLFQVVGFHWAFGTKKERADTFPFNPENIKTLVEKLEQ